MFLILLPLPFTGIIPAHAGLTSAAAAHGLRVEDHPRGCGAHVKPSSGAASRAGFPRGCRAHLNFCCRSSGLQGSPPRVRGSQYGRHQSTHAPGIIPAGAGLTHIQQTSGRRGRDHPRGCGAHSRRSDKMGRLSGSSPRMRGSPYTPGRHPPAGSSPRMRGSHTEAARPRPRRGIIPADAGLTYTRIPHSGSVRDHPRRCGAHANGVPQDLIDQGSSPRMRGSPQLDNDAFRALRIIPADAGLTTTCTTATWTSRDHPRGCGAHSVQHHLGTSSPGSSPRVRGSHSSINCNWRSFGIIPAGAGLTESA